MKTFFTKVIPMLLLVTVCSASFAPIVSARSTYPAQQASQISAPDPEFDCITGGGGIAGVFECILAYIGYQLMKFSAWIAGGTAALLNLTMQNLVVGMATFMGRIATPINDSWKLLRNLANIFLVFLITFIGIATIVGSTRYGAKQLLFRVILAALLVNFSITIAKFVIDVSNIATVAVYSELLQRGNVDPTTCADTSVTTGIDTPPNECIKQGLASMFLEKLKITTLFSADILKNDGVVPSDKYWTIAVLGFVGTALFLTIAFVFGAASLLLITRFAMLVGLIIVSPIALVLWVTQVSRYGAQWWNNLLQQSFFAPAMVLAWYVSYLLIEGMTKVFGSGMKISDIAKSTTSKGVVPLDAMSIFLYLAIAMYFIAASLAVARSMGARGASAVTRTGRAWARRTGVFVGTGVGAVTAGTTARIGRATIGRGAKAVAESDSVKNALASNNIVKKSLARTVRGTGNKVASTSFDARALAGKQAQQWIGKPKKGGRIADEKRFKEKIEEEARFVSETKPQGEDLRQYNQKIKSVEKEHKEKHKDIKMKRKEMQKQQREWEEKLSERQEQLQKTTDENERKKLKEKYEQEEKRMKKMAQMIEREEEKLNNTFVETVRSENKKLENTLKERAQQRRSDYLVHTSRERTLGIAPTPVWKTEVTMNQMRNKSKADEIADEIKHILTTKEGGGENKEE